MPADSDIPSGSVALSGLNLVAEASRFTAAQLEAVDDALLERKWTTNAEKYFYGFRYDATTDLVELATNAPAEIVRPLLQRFPGTLRVEYGEGGLENRYDDAANPHHGGAEIDTVFSLPCTSGFAYRWNNENFMVSAGHCFPPDYYVITGQIHNYGYVRGRAPYPTYDMSGIGKYPGCTQNCDTYVGSIYTEDNLVRGVGGATSAGVGYSYCRSGQETREKCSQTVLDTTDVNVCHADGCTYNVILYTAADALLSEEGDSGAPIYYFRADGRLQIVAMHIGRNGSNMYAEKWGSIQVGLGATILTCC